MNNESIKSFNLINYTHKDMNKYEEIFFVQSYKEDFLKLFDNITFNFSHLINVEIETKNGELSCFSSFENDEVFSKFGRTNKEVNMEDPDIIAITNRDDVCASVTFTNFEKDRKDEIYKSQYRIYDTALFIHSDFYYKKIINPETEEIFTLFDKYQSSLEEYCKRTRNPITIYHIKETNDPDDLAVKFENMTPIIEDIEYDRNHFFTLEKISELSDYIQYSKEELKKGIVPGEMELPSFRESWLRNFWASMIREKNYKKYEDIKLFLFLFGEKLELINIE